MKVKLAPIFSDNMVFQANKPICVFGEGKGRVKVCFLGKTYEKDCLEEKWVIYLEAFSYGGPYEMYIALNTEEIFLKNIMLGDVILCAGQSNVQFEVQLEKDGENVLENENVRYYISDMIEEHGLIHSKDGWQLGGKEKIQAFSALGFHIGDYLNKKKGVAVGIVGCFQGASIIQSWLDKESLTTDVFVPIEKRHLDSSIEQYSAWNKDSALYEYTFLPITPFAFSAVVWYQGESNTSIAEGAVYDIFLKRLITRWRKDLNDETLPFVIVELCEFEERADEGWKSIQIAQKKVVEQTKYTLFVTSSDVCEHNDIHPCDKRGLAFKISQTLNFN